MITFKLPETEDERIRCILAQKVCFANDGESYIIRSYGRRKPGRKTKYYVRLSPEGKGFALLANNDNEAVEKANVIVARLSQ